MKKKYTLHDVRIMRKAQFDFLIHTRISLKRTKTTFEFL